MFSTRQKYLLAFSSLWISTSIYVLFFLESEIMQDMRGYISALTEDLHAQMKLDERERDEKREREMRMKMRALVERYETELDVIFRILGDPTNKDSSRIFQNYPKESVLNLITCLLS